MGISLSRDFVCKVAGILFLTSVVCFRVSKEEEVESTSFEVEAGQSSSDDTSS